MLLKLNAFIHLARSKIHFEIEFFESRYIKIKGLEINVPWLFSDIVILMERNMRNILQR